MQAHADPLDRVVFDGESVRVGAFRCRPDHPRFRDSGPARHFCFVFPRTAVTIEHAGDRPFIADPTVVTFYNRAQQYRRGALSPDGDRCEWFGVAPELLGDSLRPYDPAAADDGERPLRMTHGPSSARTYARQRVLFTQLRGRPAPDPLYVEEAVVGLLGDVIADAYGRAPAADRPTARQKALAEAVATLLLRRFREPLTLGALAREAGASIYHLCRTFRQVTGVTLHEYRNQLRLRASLEHVMDPGSDLTDVALAFGYCSHSHFTAAFRRQFGLTPSALRATQRSHA